MNKLSTLIRELVAKEMAEAKQGRTAKGIKITNVEKANKVKELYSGYWIEELINTLQEAGENGMSLNDLIDTLGQPREKVRNEIVSLKGLGVISR